MEGHRTDQELGIGTARVSPEEREVVGRNPLVVGRNPLAAAAVAAATMNTENIPHSWSEVEEEEGSHPAQVGMTGRAAGERDTEEHGAVWAGERNE